ncbi:transposase [Nonomuraea sp. NPDC049649]|uniref:transposase n=1 Tax=Nonomuraea sp. NPDC049649 TaxID=3155776 RepID=UPI00343FEA39
MAHGDLTDEEWSLIEPHLPLGERGPIPDLRQQFNAVLWRFRTHSPWRDLPAEYGPWPTAYDRFRTWVAAGVFEELMQVMAAGAPARQSDLEPANVDPTTTGPAGTILGAELAQALQQAADEEKGLRFRFIPHTDTVQPSATSSDGNDDSAGSG